ncbi:gluconokinase [Microbacterium awajiense]|uniref:Gluconokinase n=2 Tax=Microbacterium awajiense TaxID=415214 RepID=A0ABP7AW11_9MICO
MGVSAVGKSSVAIALAQRLAIPLCDADDLHPESNRAKMRGGVPLTDEDRWPWLDDVGRTIADADGGIVVACSALRRVYRDRLRAHAPDVVFVHLTGTAELLAERAAGRRGHFMPPALLASQLATLEPIAPDETAVVLDVTASVDELADAAVAWIGARSERGI